MRARAALIAGWATGALALLIAAGGAAASPSGWLLGLPGVAVTACCVLALALLALLAGRAAGLFLLAALPVPS